MHVLMENILDINYWKETLSIKINSSLNFECVFLVLCAIAGFSEYLKVFDMMSGLISLKSIGLTNKKEIYKLIKESKILFSFCEWNTRIIPIITLILTIE
jgi:hypothetical protein